MRGFADRLRDCIGAGRIISRWSFCADHFLINSGILGRSHFFGAVNSFLLEIKKAHGAPLWFADRVLFIE